MPCQLLFGRDMVHNIAFSSILRFPYGYKVGDHAIRNTLNSTEIIITTYRSIPSKICVKEWSNLNLKRNFIREGEYSP
jgi:hypothetical protein